MSRKLRCNQVVLSAHAKGRLSIRAPGLKITRAQAKIRYGIASAQRKGVKTDYDGAVQVNFWDRPVMWAICYPLLQGGWVVATIKMEGWEGDMEEQETYESQASDMKRCTPECKYCQKYNDDWCICWHPKFKGSRKQLKIPCLVELTKKQEPLFSKYEGEEAESK